MSIQKENALAINMNLPVLIGKANLFLLKEEIYMAMVSKKWLGFASVALALTSTSAMADSKPMRIGWIPAVGEVCMLPAIEKLGPDVQLLNFKNSNDVLLAINTGQLDLGIVGYSVVTTALAHGPVQGKFVSGVTDGTTEVVVGTKSGINNWADMRGKNIGAIRGSSEYTSLESSLAAAGLKIGRDVNFVNFQSPTDIIVALRNGNIDAAVTSEPAIAVGVKAGFAKRMPDMTKKLFETTYGISVGLFASNDLLKSTAQRATLVKYLQVFTSGCDDLKRDPAKAVDAYLKVQTGNRDVLIDAFNAIAPGLTYKMPMDQIRVVPKYVQGVQPGQIPDLTNRFAAMVDYSSLEQATGQTAAQLGDVK
jgi:NitT/TauT family transport system substrate-binding protein